MIDFRVNEGFQSKPSITISRKKKLLHKDGDDYG